MKPLYTVVIYTPQELNHASYLQTGLFELEVQGVIKVRVKLSTAKHQGRLVVSEEGAMEYTEQAFPKTSYYKLIDHSTRKSIPFAADLYDFANQFSITALEKCDYYFKRNYNSTYVDTLPAIHQRKIHKLGLTFRVHSPYKKDSCLLLAGLFISNLLVQLKLDQRILSRLYKTYKAQLQHWNFIKTTRILSRFESLTQLEGSSILFQTRCFLHENEEDMRAIHQQRYRIIKLLRNQFPNNFLGGFVPSNFAKGHYGDALTDVPSDPERYLDVLKSAKIVIYTRGLVNSPAWKMAEYLSQGKVIIAEPMSTELPVPLQEGKEVLYFRNDLELIEKIERVLKDTSLAEELSINARAYFEKYVHPVQNTKRILELMLAKSLD
jgi:glycosyltransferase involved in cell wall biosynthesis